MASCTGVHVACRFLYKSDLVSETYSLSQFLMLWLLPPWDSQWELQHCCCCCCLYRREAILPSFAQLGQAPAPAPGWAAGWWWSAQQWPTCPPWPAPLLARWCRCSPSPRAAGCPASPRGSSMTTTSTIFRRLKWCTANWGTLRITASTTWKFCSTSTWGEPAPPSPSPPHPLLPTPSKCLNHHNQRICRFFLAGVSLLLQTYGVLL